MNQDDQVVECMQPRKKLRILAVAPHPDDVELGCGATIMRLIDEFDAECFYLVLSHQQATRNYYDRREEAIRSAIRLGITIEDLAKETFGIFRCFDRWLGCEKVTRSLRQKICNRKDPIQTVQSTKEVSHVMIENFHDMQFPDQWLGIQRRFLEIRDTVNPDLVFLPTTNDTHQDHVTTSECANREFRKGESRWYYEILQFDEKIFIPSLFVNAEKMTVWAREVELKGDSGQSDQKWFEEHSLGKVGELVPAEKVEPFKENPVAVDEEGNPVKEKEASCKVYFKQGTYAERKADLLVECFRSQRHRVYFRPPLVLGNMAGRGMQCGRDVGYAEAFQARISI